MSVPTIPGSRYFHGPQAVNRPTVSSIEIVARVPGRSHRATISEPQWRVERNLAPNHGTLCNWQPIENGEHDGNNYSTTGCAGGRSHVGRNGFFRSRQH